MKGQFVRRYGIKKTGPGRIVRTGRVSGRKIERPGRAERPLRPRMKPRVTR